MYRTTVSQIFFMTVAFLPLLDAASNDTKSWSSTMLNVTSVSGIVKTSQHHPNYNASKGAAIHLNRMLANEIQENGLKIRVNSLAPGVFPSEMTTQESDENQKSSIPKDKFEGKVPASALVTTAIWPTPRFSPSPTSTSTAGTSPLMAITLLLLDCKHRDQVDVMNAKALAC